MFTVIETIKKDRSITKHVEANSKTYDIEVRYEMGGHSYLSGRSSARGIWLSVSPITRTNLGDGMIMKSYTAFAGTKLLIKETNRFNRKALQTEADIIFQNLNEDHNVNLLFQDVLRKENK